MDTEREAEQAQMYYLYDYIRNAVRINPGAEWIDLNFTPEQLQAILTALEIAGEL
jgi:hypothetical protein